MAGVLMAPVRRSLVLLLAAALIGMVAAVPASAAPPCGGSNPTLLVTGLDGASGSTVGPDGALYVTEGAAGRISRVDPETGNITTFASGLPTSIVGIGGGGGVVFLRPTPHLLVPPLRPPVGGRNTVGI